MTEDEIAAVIVADLVRQRDGDTYDAPWLDEWLNPKDLNIDGHVSVLEVARAVLGHLAEHDAAIWDEAMSAAKWLARDAAEPRDGYRSIEAAVNPYRQQRESVGPES